MDLKPKRSVCRTSYSIDDMEEFDKVRISKFEKFVRKFEIETESIGPASIIRIPVVVHVVYHTAAENIPDAQIISQIEALNKDYRRLNSDASNVPGEFLPLAADTRIEFALAVGIIFVILLLVLLRTMTSSSQFIEPKGNPDDPPKPQPLKHTAQGGIDAWPTDKYLNIWVCNLVYDNSGIFEHSTQVMRNFLDTILHMMVW